MEVERYFADTVTVLKDGCFVGYQDFEKVKRERDEAVRLLAKAARKLSKVGYSGEEFFMFLAKIEQADKGAQG